MPEALGEHTMKNIIALIVYSFLPMLSFSQEMTTESIPNSELYVSFPSDWTFIRPYLGNGKYSSINVNLPEGEDGGTPAYPEFNFEFLNSDSKNTRIVQIRKSDLSSIYIGGTESKIFTDRPEVRYLLSGGSHAYGTLQVTGYLVPINQGYLICTLTTQSEEESEHTKYINILNTYCSTAVNSAKSPNKNSQQDAAKDAAPLL